MTNWRPDPSTLKRPAYRSLTQAVEAAIQNGTLKPGDRMPTQRQLAFDLSLSVQTVSRAYDKLIEGGKIIGEVGRGTFVRAATDDISMPFVSTQVSGQLLDMSILKPVTDHAHEEAMQKVLRSLARSIPATVMDSFRQDALTADTAETTRKWLSLCGLSPDTSIVIPTNGSTSAMNVALMTVARPGDLILAEYIGHHTLRPLTRFLGLQLQGVTVDEDGICPDALERTCRTEPVKALCVMPNGANPLAFTMSERRRRDVIDVARQHDVMIIENQAWGPLQDAPPPPLAALAPQQVLYFTSFTKCLLPGLRAGYLMVPDHLGSAAANRHLMTNWMATSLMTEIAARWIDDGTAEALLLRQRLALRDRADYAASVLRDMPYRTSPNGLHLWVCCRDAQEESQLVQSLRSARVAVAPGTSFAIGPHDRHAGIRVALGGLPFPDFARGIRTIDRIARDIWSGR